MGTMTFCICEVQKIDSLALIIEILYLKQNFF